MRKRPLWCGAFVLLAALAIAHVPTTRRVSINAEMREETLPLWVKALNFVDRDLNLRRVTEDVLGHIKDDRERALAAFAWTREHVRPQPDELPTVDDHVWHVVVRGYGESDQQADVFTTLLTYAGTPAYWTLIGTPPRELALSYVLIAGEWRVFDVARGLMVKHPDGTLATAVDVQRDHDLVRQAAQGLVRDLDTYVAHFDGYRAPHPPDVLRADLQMPGRRLIHELRSLVGVEGRVWTIRPSVAAAQGASQ